MNSLGKHEKSIFWICIIINMAMAIMAFTISLPRTVDKVNPLSLDYQGVYVAIFAVLVTVLIAWQIFVAVKIESRVDKATEKMDQTALQLNELIKDYKIKVSSDEYFASSIAYASNAVLNYIEAVVGSDKKNRLEIARQLSQSYRLAMKSLTSDVATGNNGKANNSLMELNMRILENSSNSLFNQYPDEAKLIFTKEFHNDLDVDYQQLFNNNQLFEISQIDRLSALHSKRDVFRDKSDKSGEPKIE